MNNLRVTYFSMISIVHANKDPFDYIEKNSVINNSILRGSAGSLYDLLISIGVVGLIITTMFCALKYTYTKSPDKKREIKSSLIHKFILGIVLFGFVFFAGVIAKVANAFT